MRTSLLNVRRGESQSRLSLRLGQVAWAALVFLCSAPSALAHGASAGDLAVTPEAVHLQHRRAADLVTLFSREEAPDPAAHVPRAARVDSPASLLPAGMEGLLRNAAPDTIILVGREDRFPEMRACIRMLDVPVQQLGPNRARLVLTLHRGSTREVRGRVLRLPGAGAATVEGPRLTLDGPPQWLHRALREVIRAELQTPRPESLPAS